jgi:hypothetical protein
VASEHSRLIHEYQQVANVCGASGTHTLDDLKRLKEEIMPKVDVV